MQTAAVPNLLRRFEGICKLDFSSSETIYEREEINYFWSIKNSTEILTKLETKDF